jgi:hypothetical protein
VWCSIDDLAARLLAEAAGSINLSHMRHAWLLILTIGLSLLLAHEARAQETYHDRVHGFSITVPKGWVRASQAAVDGFAITPPQGGTAKTLVGWVRGTSGDVLRPPFIVMEARTQPFSLDGLSWDELSSKLNLVPWEDLRANGQFDNYGRYRGDGLSPPALSRADELILVQGNINGPDGKPAHLYSVSFPGRREIIRMNSFAPPDPSQVIVKEVESTWYSFEFDPGHDFNPPRDSGRSSASGSSGYRFGRRTGVGSGVGLAVAVLIYVLRRWAAD